MANDGADVFRAVFERSVTGGPELFSAQEMLSKIMDSLSSGVFLKDRSSTYLACNQTFANLAGRTPEEMIGLADDAMPWSVHRPGYIDWDSRVIAENRAFTDIRESLTTIDGEILWISTNKAPLHDEDGNVIGLVGAFRDITSEVAAEAELQNSLTQLDARVTERTEQLLRANQSLRKEVDERVRLQAEERQLREYAEARREIGAAMSRTLDLEAILDVLVGGVQDLVTNDAVAVVLVNDDRDLELERLECAYDYGTNESLTFDFSSHPAITAPGVPIGSTIDPSNARTLGPARSSIAAEMLTGGVLIGYLLLESRWSDFYVHEHGERLRGVAEQAAAVISNVRLTKKAAELAAAAERDRLRRDLHDSVVQTLATAAMTVDTELVGMATSDPVRPTFERIQRLFADANGEIRKLLNEMHREPSAMADLGELFLRLANRPDWPFSIDYTMSLGSNETATDTAMGLYRIAQEALYNAAQHAGAHRVVIDLCDQPEIHLTITDDGAGFDPSTVEGDHFGLKIMAERAKDLGAGLEVESARGRGTTIAVKLEPD